MTDAGPSEPRPSGAPKSGPSPSTGLESNVAGALAYLLGPITGVLFFLLEKQDQFVRFHAAQSIGISVAIIAFWVVYGIVSTVLSSIPVLGWIAAIAFFLLSFPLAFAGLALWVYLMYRAWQGDEWEIPWVGEQSRKFLL